MEWATQREFLVNCTTHEMFLPHVANAPITDQPYPGRLSGLVSATYARLVLQENVSSTSKERLRNSSTRFFCLLQLLSKSPDPSQVSSLA